MGSYNKVLLMGNLTRDIEGSSPAQRAGGREHRARREPAARPELGRDKEVTFVDCEAWGKTAENMAKFFTKGRPVFIEGRLKLDTWQDKTDGSNRSKLKVVVESFEFVDSKGGDGGGGAGGGSGGGGRVVTRGGQRGRPAASGAPRARHRRRRRRHPVLIQSAPGDSLHFNHALRFSAVASTSPTSTQHSPQNEYVAESVFILLRAWSSSSCSGGWIGLFRTNRRVHAVRRECGYSLTGGVRLRSVE